jgi:hypothetical protein
MMSGFSKSDLEHVHSDVTGELIDQLGKPITDQVTPVLFENFPALLRECLLQYPGQERVINSVVVKLSFDVTKKALPA